MKIVDVRSRTFSVGYLPPWDHDDRYYAKKDVQENVIIELEAEDGTVGFGEAAHAPGLYGETPQATLGAIDLFKDIIVGHDGRQITDLNRKLDRVSLTGNIAARAGIDIAIHDLAGKLLNVPVYQLLGGKVRDETPTHQCPPATDELPEYVERFRRDGYRVFKLKMTGDIERDLSTVERVVREIAGESLLSLDANQGWTVAETMRVARLVEGLDSFRDNVILEQPIKGEDFDGLSHVTGNTRVRVMADDGIRTESDLRQVIERRAADIVSLKIQRVGGIQRVLRMVAAAEVWNIPYIVDEITEAKLANTAVAHVATAARSPLYTGVASHTHHDFDVVAEGGLTVSNGNVRVPDEPGLGITALSI